MYGTYPSLNVFEQRSVAYLCFRWNNSADNYAIFPPVWQQFDHGNEEKRDLSQASEWKPFKYEAGDFVWTKTLTLTQ